MGIKGLTQLLKKHSPQCYEHTKLFKLSGEKVAIDASLFIYQSLLVYRNNNDFIRNNNGKNISHIIGILNKTVTYLSYNITPIYIFDGIPPDEKNEVIQERKDRSNNAMEKINNGNLKDNIIEKYNKQSIRLNKEIINDIKLLLHNMGVSYIESNGEAEALASELCNQGFVKYVISEDMDCLPFGACNLVRNCIDKSVKMTDSITIFNLEKTINLLGLTNEQFIELCVLCGCDYCKNIPRIGSITSYKIIKKYGSIEEYLKTPNIKNIPEDYDKKYKAAIKLFNIYKNIDISKIDIKSNNIDISILINYLMNVCDFNQYKTNRIINKIQNKF
uniref:XPG N-terminal domain-containing protein n=1 Tax=viral metagenome TaxID=1070528 RepID=A0A6C0D0N4_9ZZZZ